VITGHDTDEARQRVLDAGASSYLRKPVDDQILLNAVAAAVAGGPEPKGKS
jgi:DNA-binding NarL/FixJ family response regulator